MRVRLLGTAAGGGLPQWNCGCENCVAAGTGQTARTQDSVAVSGDGEGWYLLNASPDVRHQLLNAPELRPAPGTRSTPVRGVVLSTAELDHTLGLFSLREGGALTVISSPAVRDMLSHDLPLKGVLQEYAELSWKSIAPGSPIDLDGGLRLTASPMGTKTPRYSPADSREEASVALRVNDRGTGGTLVYAPCIPAFRDEFWKLSEGADVALIDGTFFRPDEMGTRTTVSSGTQSSMGHVPISEALPLLAAHPGPRYLFTHLNNTNPAAMRGTEARRAVEEAGMGIAHDGQTLDL